MATTSSAYVLPHESQYIRVSHKWRYIRLFLYDHDQRHTVPYSLLLKDNMWRH